ncbi:3052_t:CDS:2, partial [Cetraspora pellucida]
QMQDPELTFVDFSSGKTIDKLYINCGEEVSQYLDNFDNMILTVYLALPTSVKHRISVIGTYSLRSNGFQLTIAVSKYLFENTIVTVNLQGIEIPRTVEGFSKIIKAIKIILSWKARTRKIQIHFMRC